METARALYASTTGTNVEILLPMFHFLVMKQQLEDCDNLMMQITVENSRGEKAIDSDVITDFWKNDGMQESNLQLFNTSNIVR
jgi:hypothetical protein